MIRKLEIALCLMIIGCVGFDTANAQVLDAGNTSTFAINESGNIVQWGTEFDAPPGISFPTDPPKVTAVTGGSQHGVALTATGGIFDWGGTSEYPHGGAPVTGTFTAIAAGIDTSFALNDLGGVVAWGKIEGNNGVVAAANLLTPGIQAISAGGNHFLAIENGGNVIGRGHITGTNDAAVAATTANVTDAIAISAGTDHALALRSGGTVSAWGSDAAGKATIVGVNNAVAISAGGTQSLILRSDGTVFAAGQADSFGGIQGLENVVYVSAGSLHSYAVQSDGVITGFGNSSQGQLNTTITGTLNLPTTAVWASATAGDYLNSHRWEQGIPSTAKSEAVFGESGEYTVSFGNDAEALKLNVSAGNVTFAQNETTFNVAQSITVSGAGTSLIVDGTLKANSVTNSALINIATGGELRSATTIANTGKINIATDGKLISAETIANTGEINNNGTITGNVTTTGTGVLSGSGTIDGNGITADGGVLSPGNSIGLVKGGDWTFGKDGAFKFEINDAMGVAGGPNGWDALELTGTMFITATEANPFIIDIHSLSGLDAGNAVNFNPNGSYSWAFVTAGGGIDGFNADFFSIVSTNFSNPIGADSFFSITQSGNSLFVNLTAVPEPSSLAILAVGSLGFAAYKRRRKQAVAV